jgi:HSP20 family protein
MRTDPFRELDRLTQQAFGTRLRPAVMPMDAYRENDQFIVHFDLPGVDPESVDLTVEKNVLTVTAERPWQPSDDQEVIASERPHGRFTRELFLGDNVDLDRVEARYEHGVLTVVIPVAERAKRRKVEITSGEASGNGAKAIVA